MWIIIPNIIDIIDNISIDWVIALAYQHPISYFPAAGITKYPMESNRSEEKIIETTGGRQTSIDLNHPSFSVSSQNISSNFYR